MGITDSQRDLMGFIIRYIAKNKKSPSYDEMKDGLGLASKSGIHRLINGLSDRGAIVFKKNCSRTVYPTQAYISSILSMEFMDLIFDIGFQPAIEMMESYKEMRIEDGRKEK